MRENARSRTRNTPGTASAGQGPSTNTPRQRPWGFTDMFDIPILRFGQTYESMEKQPVVHFDTGETVAQLHQATGAMVKLDLKKAQKSRDALRAVPIAGLIEICKSAAGMYLEDTLPCGSGS